jgi:hypothetical protein
MTYEPGTADILTTLDPPFPGPEKSDDKIFADLFRILLRGAGLSFPVNRKVRLFLPGGYWIPLDTTDQVDAVERYGTRRLATEPFSVAKMGLQLHTDVDGGEIEPPR